MIYEGEKCTPEVGDKVYFTFNTMKLAKVSIPISLSGQEAIFIGHEKDDKILVRSKSTHHYVCEWLDHVYPSIPLVGQRCIVTSNTNTDMLGAPEECRGRYCTIEIISNGDDSIKCELEGQSESWYFEWYYNIFPIELKQIGITNSCCPICGSAGYLGFVSFKCDNKNCQNGK